MYGCMRLHTATVKQSTMLERKRSPGGSSRCAPLLVIALLAVQASEMESARTIRERELTDAVNRMRTLRSEESQDRELKNLLRSQLPRGPVPPSGPSPCHNKKSFNITTDDYVSCP